jgi:hypothetical protein
MSQLQAEVLILTLNALGAGILMFVTGVVQKIMNQMDELEFKRFMNLLDKTAMSDPFAVTVASVPIAAAVIYVIAFGFSHWWFIAGFVVWLVGSSVTKVVNMPVYEWAANPRNTDRDELRTKRRKLQFGNNVRAWTTLVSVVLMACQFGAPEVLATIAVCVVLAVPLLWLARKYTPGAQRTVSV